MRNCLFWFQHDYEKWKDIEYGDITQGYYLRGEKIQKRNIGRFIIQERRCKNVINFNGK